MKSLLLLFYIHVLYRVAELWKCSFTFLHDSLLCTKTKSLIIFILIGYDLSDWKQALVDLIKNLLRWKASNTSKSTFAIWLLNKNPWTNLYQPFGIKNPVNFYVFEKKNGSRCHVKCDEMCHESRSLTTKLLSSVKIWNSGTRHRME